MFYLKDRANTNMLQLLVLLLSHGPGESAINKRESKFLLRKKVYSMSKNKKPICKT